MTETELAQLEAHVKDAIHERWHYPHISCERTLQLIADNRRMREALERILMLREGFEEDFFGDVIDIADEALGLEESK